MRIVDQIKNTRLWIAITAILLAWILMAYQVPALIAHESKLIEIFDRYSLWYFVILLSYLALLLILAFGGIWLIRASRNNGFSQRFDVFISDKQVYILIGLFLVWVVWILFNQSLFLPVKITQGIISALLVISISLLLLYTPLVDRSEREVFFASLNAQFFFFQILIPIGLLSLYCGSLSFFLPRGVNRVFVTKTAQLLVPRTIFLFIAYFSIVGIGKIKSMFFGAPKEKLSRSDLILAFLPLTPVVQYLINNSDILMWNETVVIFCVFLLFVSTPIYVVPYLFKNTGAYRPVMFLGLAFTFLITNMVSLTEQFNWYQYGSLWRQLLILVGIWLISSILFNSNYRSVLYILIAIHFISNTTLHLSQLNERPRSSSQDISSNMLVRLVENRKPINTTNIYLLVYDSYVENDILLSHGIDNRDHEEYLEELDFKIYPHIYSIQASSIPSMSKVLNSSASFYGVSRRGVSGDGVVQNLLMEYGYKTYGVFPSDYFFRGINPSYDYWFPGLNSSVRLIIKAIFLGEFRFDIDFDVVPEEVYINEKRNILSSNTEELRFLYTHSYNPGHSIDSGVCRPNESELYGERLVRANEEMRQDLALILEHDPEAIVIITGDHGPYLTKNCYITGDEYDISEITRLDIQDRYGTFLAIKWPTADFEDYDEITILQDLFPVIFAYMFEDQGLLRSKVEPITSDELRISGAKVSDGIIVGGMNDGEPLFP